MTDSGDRPHAPATRPGGSTAVEVAVQDPAGARVALAAGADRVELCAALGATGGVTPGAGTIRQTRAVGLPVHVLVRPRPGNFVYDDGEADVLVAEVQQAVGLGAAGVVVGALTATGEVDVPLVRRLVGAAGGTEVTFHRAFDVVADRAAALAVLGDLGLTRVLTSGGAGTAVDGVAELAALVHAAGDVQVMAGGGVRPQHVPSLLGAGVAAIHLSARRYAADGGDVGPGGGPAARLELTDGDVVRAVVATVRTVAGPA